MNDYCKSASLAWLALAAFLATILHAPICGAQTRAVAPRPSNPAVQTVPKPPAAAATAPNAALPSHDTKPIFDPAILAALGKNWQKPDFNALEAELDSAQKDVDAKQSGLHSAMLQLGMRGAFCSQFKYSAADQKNAGCAGSDTVSQCTQKLFAECTKASHADFVSKKAQMLTSAGRLEKALKAYAAALGPSPTSNVPGHPGTAIAPR